MAPRWLVRAFSRDASALDVQHEAVVVRTLAAARLVLATLGFVAFAFDPPHSPLRAEAFLVPTLVAFLIYSAGLMVAASVRPALGMRYGPVLHGLDLAWIVALTTVSDGVNSPFVAFFVYAMLAASYRWGLRATLATGAFAIAVLVADVLLGRTLAFSRGGHLNTVLVRATYFAVAAVLIGLLAQEERRQRLRSRAVVQIMSRVRGESGMVASVRAVFEDVLGRLGASRGLLILYEDGIDVASLWHARRPSSDAKVEVRLKQETAASCPTFMFPLPEYAHAIRIRRTETGTTTLDALDVNGSRCPTGEASAAPLREATFEWQTALGVSQVSGEGWRGRLFVFDARYLDDHALRFLQVVVRQVAPALFNLYLQRRLQSRSGTEDRLRVSRELHDGVIQSLIGLDMELEVLRRNAALTVPAAVGDELASIQRVLGQEILAVRDLMQSLKPVDVDPGRLPEHLAAMLGEFRHRTGVDARLSSSLDEIVLSRRTGNQIVRIVQEALANVRKHSGASNVLVQLGTNNDNLELIVDDDGKGFDFEGRLTGEELAARGRAPAILMERVRAIGGHLTVQSQPGRGTRLEIRVAR